MQERAALEDRLAALERGRGGVLAYDDAHSALAPARSIERRAAELGLEDLVVRARLVAAHVMGRYGDIAGSGKIARAAGEWAVAHGDNHVRARSERLLSTFYGRVGDAAASLSHALRAVELLADDARPILRADHLMALGIALARAQSFDAARERLQAVLSIADEVGDPALRLTALNNLGFFAYRNNDAQAARDAADQMQLTAQRHGVVLHATHLDTVARTRMMVGQYEEAERLLVPLLEPENAPLLTEADDKAGNLLTIAECQRRRGALDLALRSLAGAESECEERGLKGVLVEVMQEQATALAAQGRYREAYERHVQFHVASEALHSAEREARAYALQAVFETEEARRTGRQFRELSWRDALTGLYNRRYVDDRLAALLGGARDGLSTVAIAIVDLDHFKRVNDEISHEAGDEVLRQLAPLLQATVDDLGFAARLGGDEFLLVLEGDSALTVTAVCQHLCDAVRTHPWSPVVGDLPITVSIGVASTFGGARVPAELLTEADRRLYVAKRSGRDRVTGG